MKTMNHQVIPVKRHNFTSQDKLFFDANIWLYLYCPQGSQDYWVNTYSDIFDRILDAESQIYIDVLVVSEFINTFARQEWRLAGVHSNSFKTFRSSPNFKPTAEGIAAAVKQIMQHCLPVESCFTTLEINELLTDYSTGNFDFNDQVITEICKNNGFTLITNDSDFKTHEISILTANPSLLTN